MTQAMLHIAFSMSAAMDLRMALAQDGRGDRVLALSDCLSFGPINPYDSHLRVQWVEMELGYDGWAEVATEADGFWLGALGDNQHRVVWMSRRSTQEYSGFLEFVWRNGNKPFEVVDLTDLAVAQRRKSGESGPPSLVGTLALLRADEIIENQLWERAQTLSPTRLEQYRLLWGRLRDENAALRILDHELNLMSAPIAHFDERLLSSVKTEWQKAARVIGDVLADFLDEPRRFQVSDLVLASRLRALVDGGRLEEKGDLADLQSSWVRLPS